MKYLVYGSLRSGTNYVSEWLFPYLHDHFGCCEQLREFFVNEDFKNTVPWSFDGDRIVAALPHVVPVLERLDWLQRSPYFYLIKEVSTHDHPIVLDYLRQHYHAVVTYRKNVWQQLLSFVISLNTMIWYRSSPMLAPHVTVSRAQFDFAVTMTLRGHATGRSFPHKTLVAYEEFCVDPHHLLVNMGLSNDGYDPYRHPLFPPRTLKVNHDHEASINNLNEVKDWYQDWRCQCPDLIEGCYL